MFLRAWLQIIFLITTLPWWLLFTLVVVVVVVDVIVYKFLRWRIVIFIYFVSSNHFNRETVLGMHLSKPDTTSNMWHKARFFKQSKASLNSEFSFLTSCLTRAKKPCLPYYLLIAGEKENRWIHSFPKSISTKWNKQTNVMGRWSQQSAVFLHFLE